MKTSFQSILVLAGLSLASPAFADLLFFNGNPNGSSNGGNFLDCSNCRSSAGNYVYDDFVISSGTWTVTGLLGDFGFFSNSPLPSTATWAIRTGISQGNSGTLVATGTTSIALTPVTGTFANNYQASLTISPLVLGPGTYWMALAPAALNDESYVIGTNGVGGTNSVIDGQSYAIGLFPSMTNIGGYLQPFTGSSSYDFSYGVTGTSVGGAPEPASLGLVGISLGAIGILRKRIRSARSASAARGNASR